MEDQWLIHQNPVERYFYIQSFQSRSTSEKTSLVARFLSGDWDVFGTFAQLVIAGKLAKPSKVEGTTTSHSRFWSSTFWSVPRQQQIDFLSWLLSAQMANSGAKKFPGLSRNWPKPSDSSVKLLLQYLNGFSEPQRNLVGQFPDERVIDLLRDVPLESAMPIFRKVIPSKRHFDLLKTDYSTLPEEQDQVLRAALGALVSQSKAAGPVVKAELQAMLKVALESEVISLKIEDGRDYGRGGDPEDNDRSGRIRTVEGDIQKREKKPEPVVGSNALAPAVTPDLGELNSFLKKGIRTRTEWLKVAIDAINKNSSALEEFTAFRTAPSKVKWLRKTDERSVAVLDHAEPSRSEVFGSSFGLDAFDRLTGKLIFSINFEEESDEHSMDRHVEYRVLADGKIAMWTAFFEKKPKLRRSYQVVVVDPQNGEVRSIVKASPDDGATFWPIKTGFLFEKADRLWIQGIDEKLKAERVKIKDDKVFVTDNHRIFLFTKGAVEELGEDLKPLLGWMKNKTGRTHFVDSPDSINVIEDQLMISNSTVLVQLSSQGDVISTTNLKDHKVSLNPILSKDRIWVAETFAIVAIDRSTGEILKRIASTNELGEWVPVGHDRIGVLTKGEFFLLSTKEEVLTRFEWPKEFRFAPHMSSLSSTADASGGAILKTYNEGHWLMRID